jgi:hypothetical protein
MLKGPSVVLLSERVGVLEVELQQIPDAVMGAPPLSTMDPPLLAVVSVMDEAALVADRLGTRITGPT